MKLFGVFFLFLLFGCAIRKPVTLLNIPIETKEIINVKKSEDALTVPKIKAIEPQVAFNVPIEINDESPTITVEQPKKITVVIPKKIIKDTFTGVSYTQIGITVQYDSIMYIGKSYEITVKTFRDTFTEDNKEAKSIAIFTSVVSKNVGVILESSGFKIIKQTASPQILLPEGNMNQWTFEVVPIKTGIQSLNIKIGTSNTNNLTFNKIDTKQIVVKNSANWFYAKLLILKESYINNQSIYNGIGTIIVFLMGFFKFKKRQRGN